MVYRVGTVSVTVSWLSASSASSATPTYTCILFTYHSCSHFSSLTTDYFVCFPSAVSCSLLTFILRQSSRLLLIVWILQTSFVSSTVFSLFSDKTCLFFSFLSLYSESKPPDKSMMCILSCPDTLSFFLGHQILVGVCRAAESGS